MTSCPRPPPNTVPFAGATCIRIQSSLSPPSIAIRCTDAALQRATFLVIGSTAHGLPTSAFVITTLPLLKVGEDVVAALLGDRQEVDLTGAAT